MSKKVQASEVDLDPLFDESPAAAAPHASPEPPSAPAAPDASPPPARFRVQAALERRAAAQAELAAADEEYAEACAAEAALQREPSLVEQNEYQRKITLGESVERVAALDLLAKSGITRQLQKKPHPQLFE